MTPGETLTRTYEAGNASTEAAQGSIAHWLLHGPAQVASGPQAGAVAGAVDATGHAVYAYPEITGYYLQWLAWRATRHEISPELIQRADAVQQWLGRWLAASGPLLTRIHLDGADEDWRNSALFCFDLAMVLRGVGSAVAARLIEPDTMVVAGVCSQLERLIGRDGLFDACAAQPGFAELPARWSTRRGGFLAKAAAGVLSAASTLPDVPVTVRDAARKTASASLGWAAESPHDEVHPLLYTFEGLLSLPAEQVHAALPVIAAQFAALLDDARALGRVPESRQPGTLAKQPERLDVIAQTIRIGHLLAAYQPHDPPDRIALARLQQVLVANVRPDGAVPFAIGQHPTMHNVWAAMFAQQALGFAPRVDDPLDVGTVARLLV